MTQTLKQQTFGDSLVCWLLLGLVLVKCHGNRCHYNLGGRQSGAVEGESRGNHLKKASTVLLSFFVLMQFHKSEIACERSPV